ncbi:hypothetical protein B4099_0160 [Heyndrickxia coagulans]|uniref:Uncharacterized protein n=1 Tax=Heyndrickxia coagulans TaxID=1398 RepID=A0A150K081_HEYCO|nr:hypothetical protein B4099_0160 [Heyndrickxia coagulans]
MKDKGLYLPIDTDLPFSQLEGIELRFVKNVKEIIQSLSGQAELFSSERILPSIVSCEQPYLFDKDLKNILLDTNMQRVCSKLPLPEGIMH